MTVIEFFTKHVPFLAGLGEAEARELAQAVEQATYAKGKLVVMQGETVDCLHVIAAGKVSVTRREKGKDPVTLATLGPGDVFGEASILEMGVAGATIRAVEDATILRIRQEAFIKAMAGNAALKESLLAKVAARRAKPA